ncbi:heat shock protein Hsp20 [Halopolyspora algeriensis]|uniref:Heat shock protein Hsp20 n=1 Tax=Halopolyspora algeriensis TaxID=1500506 RepID=A0A368VIZ7_9ACTN|nr:Hsp20/alpha crystallin family protein [Halopolyspora algeriensis]RCW39634.1 heat shock protein Hsp20 [Halopolyspora algeriensis]TQM54073.1 heat shock protein Hsp20 [Halopolyspora algeriensis]
MTSMLPRPGSALPDLLHWFESEWPFEGRHPMRVESYTDEGEYVIRCELPGMDPDRDIHLTVEGNQLRVSAERTSEERTDRHSEFRYGSFLRTINLPMGCDTDEIKATYDTGILSIRIPKRETSTSKEIPVARSGE